ncbi:TOMM precursor leader peptide-binding protein [Pseudalkalibacillus berkeleyi]|uniref:TOMM leader peptide-binding protein n=1 Tax=Pseudalkalibacillus berkeleyi TaxID=1069813 RepID=A0ABS9GY94_9BACL|nr:TOMM precursor leader peptide-binding protein [Pseudalkalibacillus berkeleyi]MCF6136507.1 TOMM precursor leader peptide-binding protein [Pseudalkalibacillus berkeleyi]
MRASILVVGHGLLADYVMKLLANQYDVKRRAEIEAEVPLPTDLILVLHDTWTPAVHQQAEEVYRSLRIPWLRGFVAFGEGVIGPLVHPDQDGCSQCADTRRLMAGRDRKEMWDLQQQRIAEQDLSADAWASNCGLLQMAQLLHYEALNVLERKQAKSEDHIYLLNMKTFEGSWRFILPDALCPVCNTIPRDEPVHMALESSPKINSNSFRCRPIDELKEVLAKDYLDHRTGLLNTKVYDSTTLFADAIVNLPLFNGDEGTAGRTHSYELSESTAILEALERSCGVGARGKQTVVYDTYKNIAPDALNPLSVGVHSDAQYDEPHFPFMKFDPERKMNWVWGYSFLQEKPILVPELLAYYSMGCGGGMFFETSNGCALGGSREEAIFYGMMEVVERDAFLLTWYAQLNLPQLDPYSSEDKELQLMVDRMREVAGYDLHLYNATMENGIPSVWAMAKNRKEEGMNLICAAGAHLDPIRATKSAVYELAGMVLAMDEQFESKKTEHEKMLTDPYLVRKMDDHGMLYGLKEAEERLNFLLKKEGEVQSFIEAFQPRAKHHDLTDDLKEVMQTFFDRNMDVIVVDQTTSEIRRNGLHCVKVIIPGMLPMTFGHHLTRVKGLERVLHVPVELGYRQEPLTYDQLNQHPHPFP